MKLRPGVTAGMRNRSGPAQGNAVPGGFPIMRADSGGMMPGMPGARKITNSPVADDDEWEVPKSRSMPRGNGSVPNAVGRNPPAPGKSMSLNTRTVIHQPGPTAARPLVTASPPTPPAFVSPADLARKTKALLEEYFNVRLLDEAVYCIGELKSPAYHPDFVKQAISYALDKGPSCIGPLSTLLHHLHTKEVLTSGEIGAGCILFASISIDLPKAPSGFGEVLGKAIITKEVDFKLVNEILQKVEDDLFQKKAIFNSTIQTVSSSPSGQGVLTSQAADISACQSLFQ